MSFYWILAYLLLILVACVLDELRFKSKVERRGGSWLFSACITAAIYFGYYAGSQHAWFH